MKRDCELDSADGGGSSFRSIERCVARRVAMGLGAETAESEPEEVGEGFGKELVGSSRRKGSGLVWVTGELRTASLTGSKAGMMGSSESG